jgi:predicted transcriptional regulator
MALDVNVKVKIDRATAKQLRAHAIAQDSSASRIIRAAIREYLQREAK